MNHQPTLFPPLTVPVLHLGTEEARQWYEQVWQAHGKPDSCPVPWALKALEDIERERPTSETAAEITSRFYESMPSDLSVQADSCHD